MTGVPTDVAATQRSRWLAEISDALAEAQDLVWQLAMTGSRDVDALDLSARIESARAEAQSMRINRAARDAVQMDPEWISSPWDRQFEASA